MTSRLPRGLAIGTTAFLIASAALFAWSRAGGEVPPAAATGMSTARNVDHVGFSVPDLNQAVAFFVDTLGAQVLMTGGPWSDPKGGSFARVLGVDPAASIRVAMLRVGPVTSVELVEFTAPGQRREMPKASDWGAAHLAFYVDDIDGAASRLKARGVKVLDGPVTNGPGPIEGSRYVYFMSPWGMPMELEARQGALPYEGPGRHPYGPAPSWNWRPAGENEREVTLLQTLTPASASAGVGPALADVERAVRALPGAYEYRWLSRQGAASTLRAYGRFADPASAAAAVRQVETRLSSIGAVETERFGPSSKPGAVAP